jgi:hypothetical protein
LLLDSWGVVNGRRRRSDRWRKRRLDDMICVRLLNLNGVLMLRMDTF